MPDVTDTSDLETIRAVLFGVAFTPEPCVRRRDRLVAPFLCYTSC